MLETASNVVPFSGRKVRQQIERRGLDELFKYYDQTALRVKYASQRIRIIENGTITHGVIMDLFNVDQVHRKEATHLELGVIYTNNQYQMPVTPMLSYVTIKPKVDELHGIHIVDTDEREVVEYTYTKQ